MRKIEQFSTSELQVYRNAAELVCYKCDTMYKTAMGILDKDPSLDFRKELEGIKKIHQEHYQIGADISEELEKRMKAHFGIKNSALSLKRFNKSLMDKLAEAKKDKEGAPEMNVAPMEVVQ